MVVCVFKNHFTSLFFRLINHSRRNITHIIICQVQMSQKILFFSCSVIFYLNSLISSTNDHYMFSKISNRLKASRSHVQNMIKKFFCCSLKRRVSKKVDCHKKLFKFIRGIKSPNWIHPCGLLSIIKKVIYSCAVCVAR